MVKEVPLPSRAAIGFVEVFGWGRGERNITIAVPAGGYTTFDVPANFAIKFPDGTQVSDRIMKANYTIGPATGRN